MKSGVSVIICCYNSESRIKNVLQHLEIQKETNDFAWEVIVVDNASSDNTAGVAKKSWSRKDLDLQVVFEEKPGLSNARTKGLSVAKYSVIVFVDDDNLVSEDYIAKAYSVMASNSAIGLAGGLGFAESSIPLPEWFDNYQDAYAVGPQADEQGPIPETRMYLHGAGLVMRKEAWDMIMNKGFGFILSGRKGKSMSSGEDSEISSAFRLAGYTLWYDPGLRFRHIISANRLSWKYLVNLTREFGKSFVVLDMYISEIQNNKGWEKAKSHNWILGTAISVYQWLKLIPAYLYLEITNPSGQKKVVWFSYQTGILIQRFKLLGNFNKIKKEISDIRERLKPDS